MIVTGSSRTFSLEVTEKFQYVNIHAWLDYFSFIDFEIVT